MKIKTSELTGAALDWAVAKCEGVEITFADGTGAAPKGEPSGQWEMYSTNWAEGGPIIERVITKIEDYGDSWGAEGPEAPEQRGPTILTAVMRCYIASQLGDEVEIPEELI